MDKEKRELLNKAILDRKNIFIAGGERNGKTSLVTSLVKGKFIDVYLIESDFIYFKLEERELAQDVMARLLGVSDDLFLNFGIISNFHSIRIREVAYIVKQLINTKDKIIVIDNFDRLNLTIPVEKNFMPILTKYFPNIQFVVVTNSPFVINSIPAFIYNCSNGFWYDDVTMYSCEALVECFLDTDKYSLLVMEKYKRLKELHKKYLEDTASREEDKEYIELERYFEQTPIQLDNNLGLNLCVFQLDKVLKNREKNEV